MRNLEPGHGVDWEEYDKNGNGVIDADTDELTEFNAARLSAAYEWAKNEWTYAVLGLRSTWEYNWKNETIHSGDSRYFDHDRWYVWQTKYDGDGKPLPNEFYNDAFPQYKTIMDGVSLGPVNGPSGSVESACEWAQAHFKATNSYRQALDAYDLGYRNLISNLDSLKNQLIAAKQSYIDAWETQRNLYISYASPYRKRAYELTHQASYVEPYGDWSGWDASSGAALAGKWGDFEEEYQGHTWYFASSARDFDDALEKIEQEIAAETASYETYKQGIEAFDNWLPQYFKYNAEVQTELVQGLSIVNNCLNELETLRGNYPDWVTEFNVTANINSVVGGIIIPNNIRQMIADDYGLDMRSYILAEDDYPVLENRVAPQVGTWLQREKELLNQIYRADRLLGEASHKRPQDVAYQGWSDAELHNLNTLPGVSHGVVIEPMLDLISHSDPYYQYHNSLNYFYESDSTPALPAMPGYTVQLSVLYDDMMGNGAPMRAMRARYARFMEERGDLLRLAYNSELYQENAYDTAKGVSKNYFNDTYPSNWSPNNSKSIEYWASRGSFRLWDLYNFLNGYNGNENFADQIGNITSINYGTRSYNPVNRLQKGGRVNAFLAPKDGAAYAALLFADAPADATLEVGETTRFAVTAVGENDAFDPTYTGVYRSSSDESIATVDMTGKVTALLPGTVTITATAADSPAANPITADYTVQVKSGAYTSLAELGGGIYILSPEVASSGSRVTVTGLLGTNDSDDFARGTILAAIWSCIWRKRRRRTGG